MTRPGGVLLVGGGKMGGALLAGWRKAGTPADQLMVVEPAAAVAAGLAGHGVTVVPEPYAVPPSFRPDTIVLAIKPQMMEGVLPFYQTRAASGALVLSIAAGRTIQSFERVFGQAAIVRAMPNTPAAIGQGITVACANGAVSDVQKARATSLLEAAGAVEWVADEALMDPVTALSGSGPAYVFLLIETLAAAGVAVGLPAPLAERLARYTVAGAGALALASSEPAEQLRRNVTSPGGTTAAALEILMAEPGLAELMRRAVEAATRRSRALAR
jgi:pyrroline-5-carboxylate reductase